jgi:hypothetical protein
MSRSPTNADGQSAARRLPQVGDIFWIDPNLMDFGYRDKKPSRPAVVVQAPRDWLDRVTLVTRTSDEDAKGIPHPADPKNGCNKPGVFSRRYWGSIEMVRFVEPLIELRGTLLDPYLEQVVQMWQEL